MQKLGVMVLVSTFLLVVFFADDVFAGPRHVGLEGSCNSGEVKIGEWCYSCEKDFPTNNDGVCPNDLFPGTCTGDNWDYDCVSKDCNERTSQSECKSGVPANFGSCDWFPQCNGNLYSSGGFDRCANQGTYTYSLTAGQCGVQCTSSSGYDHPNQCNGGQKSCTAPNTSGGCNDVCSGSPNYQCVECSLSCSCNSGWIDLNGNPADGCEYSCNPTGAEICDGIDNNCNGQIDEGLNAPLNDNQNGICSGSVKTCAGGSGWQNSYNGISGYQSSESSCNDGIDNDCDVEKDWDTWQHRGPQKGDNQCLVSVNSIAVSNSNPFDDEKIDVSCTINVGGINSVRVFVDSTECVWNDGLSSWSGNTAVFRNCGVGNVGSKSVRCTVDSSKSYQSSTDKSVTINVKSSDCGGYSSAGSCPTARCEWCSKCSGTKWNGFSQDSCVSIGQCSGYQCNVFQSGENGNTCGAGCDGSIGCSATAQCNGNIYQTRSGSCDQNSCGCSYGGWVSSDCTTSKQQCGAQCANNEIVDTGIDYCGGDGDIWNRIDSCGGSCSFVDNGAGSDTKSVTCVDSCSDSDGGVASTVAGTVTDKNKCSGSAVCPTVSSTDFCSGDALTEYSCSGLNAVSDNINCDVNSVSPDFTQNVCGWSDGSCSSGACVANSQSFDCDAYHDTQGGDGVIAESLVTSNSCSLGCGGSGCCSITPYTATGSCSSRVIAGITYVDYRDNDGVDKWNVASATSETSCRDWKDNDCNGRSDYDDKDGRHGDGGSCALSISQTRILKNGNVINNIVSGDSVDVECSYSPVVPNGVNSVFAYFDNNGNNVYDSGDVDLGWDADDGWSADWSKVFFRNEVVGGVGDKKINCGVYSSSSEPYDRSVQNGGDASSLVRVVSGTCSQRSQNDCTKVAGCKWVNQCISPSPSFTNHISGACIPTSQQVSESCSVTYCPSFDQCDGSTEKQNNGLYCNTNTGDVHEKIIGCNLNNCVMEDGVEGDPVASGGDCSNTCVGSSDPNTHKIKDDTIDNNLCGGGQTFCPSISNPDVCLNSNTLREYYCSAGDSAFIDVNCNNYDNSEGCSCSVSGSNLIETCSDYGCSAGKCSVVGTSQLNAYSSDGLCDVRTCRGGNYKSYMTNGGSLTWGNGEQSEGACNDGFDNNCDGVWDYDTIDRGLGGNKPNHGASECSIGITNTILSKSIMSSGSTIDVTCVVSPVVNGGVNSIFAYFDNNGNSVYDSGDADLGWEEGDDGWSADWSRVIFRNEVVSGVGIRRINCGVYSSSSEPYDRSYQSGNDASSSVTVISSTCSDRSENQCESVAGCKWVDQCRNNNPKYSGNIGRCVQTSQNIAYSCSVSQCGEECDGSTLAACSNTLRCSGRVIQTWAASCSNTCGCQYSYVSETCDVNQCNAQCNTGDIRDDGNYCAGDGNIWSRKSGCSNSCVFDDAVVNDLKVNDCVDSCSDSDGGVNFDVQGTVVDNDKCSSGDSCPTANYVDSCNGNVLTEYSCNNVNVASTTKNCNDFDSVVVSGNSCIWDDYSCGSGICDFVSGGVSCNDYLDTNGNDGIIKDSVANQNSCDLGCSGIGCCQITTYNAADYMCQSVTVNGQDYKAYRTNSGQNVWVLASSSLPSENSCSDAFDNDCDGLFDCIDSDCAQKPGPGGKTCCQERPDCPADGSVGYTSCINDNNIRGERTLFSCTNFQCASSQEEVIDSCNTGCCLPGAQSAACIASGQSSMMDIETKPGPDGKYELCYVPVTVGDWIGANCAGNDCEDDASQPFSYECFDDNDCNSLDAGECGVAVCEDYICITKKKTDARQTCDALASSSGYQCSDFASCTNDVGTRWDCNFNGYSFLCGQNGHGFDVGCSGSPDYQCNVQLCLDASENPCSLCYSQCLNAANDPNRSPSSSNSCVKNGYWAQCGGG